MEVWELELYFNPPPEDLREQRKRKKVGCCVGECGCVAELRYLSVGFRLLVLQRAATVVESQHASTNHRFPAERSIYHPCCA